MELRHFILCAVTIVALALAPTYASGQTLKQYAKQRQAEIAEMHRVEQQKYENACKSESLSDLQEYLKKYPKGKYVQDVKNRIAEYGLWENAKRQNTVASYENYLDQSKYLVFKTDAYAAITELHSLSEWSRVKNTSDVRQIEAFVQKYPNSSCIETAKKRMHELKGISYYQSHSYYNAYNEFNEAGGRYAIAPSSRLLYDECEEQVRFSNLSSNSSESDLQAFLARYPNSKFADQVSNWIAVAKAKSFTAFSGQSSYDLALSYAKDDYTRNTVNSYIKMSKDSYSEYKRQQRRNRRRANGGLINFGFEIMDWGMNVAFSDRYNNIMYYNVGASIKLGNYKDAVQLEIGIKPGLYVYNNNDDDDSYDYYDYGYDYDYDYDYDYGDETYKFHMPVYARLKINLFNAGSNSKFYIGGAVLYNAVKVKDVESDASWQGGFGVAWRHWDWTILYYRQDINSIYKDSGLNDDKMLGCSFVYYL